MRSLAQSGWWFSQHDGDIFTREQAHSRVVYRRGGESSGVRCAAFVITEYDWSWYGRRMRGSV